MGVELVISGLEDAWSGDVEDVVVDAMARRAEEMQDRLRGAGPGGGITPFDTGRLLTSAEVDVRADGVIFTNDAAELGRESYAEFAHFSGDETGGYARDAEALFLELFGDSFAAEIERLTAEVIDAG